MAKREREEEFEVSEVAPLQPLSRCLLLHSPLSVQCMLLYNDLYQYQCYYYVLLYNDLYQYQC